MKLFVYGTLKYPEIVKALTGKNYGGTDTIIPGYRVVALKNKPYPGLVISDEFNAIGKLIDVDDKSYSIISAWEDIVYSPIEIIKTVNGNQIKAYTFLHTVKAEQLPTKWDEENFKKNHLNDYVQNRIPEFLNQLV